MTLQPPCSPDNPAAAPHFRYNSIPAAIHLHFKSCSSIITQSSITTCLQNRSSHSNPSPPLSSQPQTRNHQLTMAAPTHYWPPFTINQTHGFTFTTAAHTNHPKLQPNPWLPSALIHQITDHGHKHFNTIHSNQIMAVPISHLQSTSPFAEPEAVAIDPRTQKRERPSRTSIIAHHHRRRSSSTNPLLPPSIPSAMCDFGSNC